MLYHHGNQKYAVAAAAAAAAARAKIEQIIERGRARAEEVIATVEERQPRDEIREAQQLAEAWRVVPQDNGPAALLLGQNGNAWRLHPHAQQQAATRAGLPNTYLRSLLDDGSGWAAELAQRTLRDLYANRLGASRVLLRALATQDETGANRWEVRGLLSDRYRRLDSRPIFNAFCGAAQQAGLVPVDGTVTETKVALKALFPAVFEPVQNEVIAFGLQLRNSDFGDGKLTLAVFMLRLWCTNFAISTDELSKVHLGARLPDDLRLSQKTYELDTEANASAVHDLAASALSPRRIEEICETVRASAEETITPGQAARMISAKLNKDEQAKALDLFARDEDQDSVPVGKGTRYKLSQAVSWLAGSAGPDRRLELQQIAGELSGINAAA